MAADVLPDPSTPYGARVRQRLADDKLLWFTTVGNDGTPQPNPVWFVWDDDAIIVYNRADAHRLNHIRQRPNVSLNFDGNGQGGDIVVARGHAEIVEGEPSAAARPDYVAKYGDAMTSIAGSPEGFAHVYPVVVRVTVTGVRGH